MAFSAMHCNIRSLSANHDNLIHMLSELDHSFPLIGLSETKNSHGKDLLVNGNSTGYDFVFFNLVILMQKALLSVLRMILSTLLEHNLQNLLMTLKPYGLKLIFITRLNFYVE